MDFLKERAAVFEQLHPDISITFTTAGGDYASQFKDMLAAGTPPDVTDFYPALAGDLIPQGVFSDLGALLKADTGQAPSQFFAQPVLDAVSFEGALWSLPIYINPRVTYYNQDRFDEAGLASPNTLGDGWSWEAFRQSARKLTADPNGDGTPDRYGTESLTYYLSWQQLVHQAGGQVYDRGVSPQASLFASEPDVTAINFARQLIVDDGAVGGRFADGSAGMTISAGPSLMPQIKAGGFTYDVGLEPKGPSSHAAVFGIGGLEVVKASPHQQAAWEWVKFLTLDADSVQQYVRTNQRVPALSSVQSRYKDLVADLPPHYQAFVDTAAQPNSFTLYVLTHHSSEINTALNAALEKIFSGQSAAKPVLEQLQAQVNALLQD